MKQSVLDCLALAVAMVLLGASLVSCALGGPVDRSLLSGDPCEPPCWQGLVPGFSTAQEVEDVLAASEYVKQDSVQRERWGGFRTIWWESTASWASGSGRNAAVIKGEMLQVLMLCLDYELALEDIVGRYGTPEKLWAARTSLGGVEVAVRLYYPGEGLIPTLVLQPTNGYYELEPGSKVTAVRYFAPTSLEGLIDFGESIPFPPREYVDTDLADWQGYGPIDVR
jgi:hypothetical protein